MQGFEQQAWINALQIPDFYRSTFRICQQTKKLFRIGVQSRGGHFTKNNHSPVLLNPR